MASCKVVAWRAKDWPRRIRGVMREWQHNKLESLARTLLDVEAVERPQLFRNGTLNSLQGHPRWQRLQHLQVLPQIPAELLVAGEYLSELV